MNGKTKPHKVLHGLECLKCPYYLGFIKFVKSPCIECLLSHKKEHPFARIVPNKKSAETK